MNKPSRKNLKKPSPLSPINYTFFHPDVQIIPDYVWDTYDEPFPLDIADYVDVPPAWLSESLDDFFQEQPKFFTFHESYPIPLDEEEEFVNAFGPCHSFVPTNSKRNEIEPGKSFLSLTDDSDIDFEDFPEDVTGSLFLGDTSEESDFEEYFVGGDSDSFEMMEGSPSLKPTCEAQLG